MIQKQIIGISELYSKETEELKEENKLLEIKNEENDSAFMQLYGLLDFHNVMEDTTPKLMEMITIVDKTIYELKKDIKEWKETDFKKEIIELKIGLEEANDDINKLRNTNRNLRKKIEKELKSTG